jgi:predicted CoA-substrate-specific enzyme activase
LHETLASFRQIDRVALTGRKFKDLVNLPTITEPEAVEIAAQNAAERDGIDAIVSAGGETFLMYCLNRKGEIAGVHSGNKCASGTGEFFLQQIRRMNLDIESAIQNARGSSPYRVSGRCSVFCKSDCTHALNRGEPIGSICAGLCEMMAEKILELTASKGVKRIMLIGGTTRNRVMVENLRRSLERVVVPAEATFFEAMGAALWALGQGPAEPMWRLDRLFKQQATSFSFLPALSEYRDLVDFHEMSEDHAQEGDRCIVGLDVGSTTTKAVVLRCADLAILASVYLRTNGDPVAAARKCYDALDGQITTEILIIGLGVTGSGRQIAGLHALSLGIINEIIAHATAAVHFDKEVDTIFEIGGQDAKYTYIINGVPSDYAMNEACSAGTGSFLEEAARESFDLDYPEIERYALSGSKPPNFNDQCAAFINSDIKTALHEGIGTEDIMAGLVYSICANYLNKVKGARPFGQKIFMQGGVCYNKAVPIAMASLLNRKIVVPPNPGLMGAFGVALEMKNRLELGLMREQEFRLKDLAEREVEYIKRFTCPGGTERCDRKCEIRLIQVEGEKHPFGGSCNRYYNLRIKESHDAETLNLVKLGQKLAFEKYCQLQPSAPNPPTIGFNKSFLMNSYYPLFYNFFTHLGMKVILSKTVKQWGINKKCSSFCYPFDISHGLYASLLEQNPDYLFIPHIIETEGKGDAAYKSCIFVQSEAYILRETFRTRTRTLAPLLWFRNGIEPERMKFIDLAKQAGSTGQRAVEAFDFACRMQREYVAECKRIGERFLEELGQDEIAIVLFGRSYNAFADEANMGIPHKFASRGVKVIPYDFFPLDDEAVESSMYWGQGRKILAGARFVRNHPNLYGTYITNFSCGPDSFLIGYFRDIMGHKPSLTLELDSHTADTGLNTRVEAMLDIVRRYRELEKRCQIGRERKTNFTPASLRTEGKEVAVLSSRGQSYAITDPRVKVLLPSMGELNVAVLAAVLRRVGIHAWPLPVPDFQSLKTGRKCSSCKECLPLQLTIGTFLNRLPPERSPEEVTIFFMPGSDGPCRFGQYHVYMRQLLEKLEIENVAVLSLNAVNGYSEISFLFNAMDIFWQALIFADLMEDARSALRVLALDATAGLQVHERQWDRFIRWVEAGPKKEAASLVRSIAGELRKIPLKYPASEAKYVLLTGEIYVRADHFCQRDVIRYLESRGFIVRVAPISEWIAYLSHMFKLKPYGFKMRWSKKLRIRLVLAGMNLLEKRIKEAFCESGLYDFEMIDVPETIRHSKYAMSQHLYSEALLTVGLSLREILHNACGVVAIGPFGCMPSRLSEALLTTKMSVSELGKMKRLDDRISQHAEELPFLAIETDGNPFPQLIQARLESFCLQANRIHTLIRQI